MTRILGIETSCDETAVAVVDDGRRIHCNLVSSQVAQHAPFGGIVPEVASRHHLELLQPLVEQALASIDGDAAGIDAVAVTHGPGLVGALLVGLAYAKGLALAWNKPLIAVNHLEGHLYAPWMDAETDVFPHVALLVSGGHTSIYLVRAWGDYQLLGQTRDDAIGEAYDKVAKYLGLGYPGGPIIDRLAAQAQRPAFELPRPMLSADHFDFSYSGLKTAVITALEQANVGGVSPEAAGVARAFQDAAVDVAVGKTLRAAREFGCKQVTITGGVAANSRLRALMRDEAASAGIEVRIPPFALCTDNAAMIAGVAYQQFNAGVTASLDVSAFARLPPESWRVP